MTDLVTVPPRLNPAPPSFPGLDVNENVSPVVLMRGEVLMELFVSNDGSIHHGLCLISLAVDGVDGPPGRKSLHDSYGSGGELFNK